MWEHSNAISNPLLPIMHSNIEMREMYITKRICLCMNLTQTLFFRQKFWDIFIILTFQQSLGKVFSKTFNLPVEFGSPVLSYTLNFHNRVEFFRIQSNFFQFLLHPSP